MLAHTLELTQYLKNTIVSAPDDLPLAWVPIFARISPSETRWPQVASNIPVKSFHDICSYLKNSVSQGNPRFAGSLERKTDVSKYEILLTPHMSLGKLQALKYIPASILKWVRDVFLDHFVVSGLDS